MPKCSVVGCSSRKKENQKSLSLHRLPKSEFRRKQWLEAVGIENIRSGVKDIFICSLHFHESAFNRTMDVIRLRDDAIPILIGAKPYTGHEGSELLSETNQGEGYMQVRPPLTDHLNLLPVGSEIEIIAAEPVPGTSGIGNLMPRKIQEDSGLLTEMKQSEENTPRQTLVTYDQSSLNFPPDKSAPVPGTSVAAEANKIKALEHKCDSLRRKIRTLNEKVRRQKKKIVDFKNIIKDLQERNLMTSENSMILEACAGPKDFLKRQILFFALKSKVQASTETVICALIFDEMSIRKSLCWDPQTKSYCGRITVGESDNDSLEVANQCFVILLNCINGRWKIPVGYFFITSLTGEQKAELLKMCIQKCEEVGVIVVSVTCDGPAANFGMYSEFGCHLAQNQEDTTFNVGKTKLHAFIDPCHSIKLIRNTFGDLKILYDNYGRMIEYKYLEMLLHLQEQEGLHMGTKITKAHLYFAKQKMKVRLATQLLSSSVAHALEFCKIELNIKEFQNCEGTVNFIRILNDVFDVLNSHSIRPPGWKKAMCPDNIGFVEALFEGAIGYINNLKLSSGELVINSKRKTGFIGLVIDMKSALKLFQYLVQDTKIIKYLPLYKISQDHVELFFSAIRARGGFNNNPNAVQLKAAFKRLLIRAEIRDGGIGNCITLEQVNILNCSSTTNPTNAINELTEKNKFVDIPEDDSDLYEEYIDCLNGTLSKYSESVSFYIAGFVARKVSRTLKCETCISLLLGDQIENDHSLIKFKTRGGLTYPSKDLKDIIQKTEKLIKTNLNKNMPQNYYLYIFKFIMDYYYNETTYNIFASQCNDHDAKHKHLLIKSVIQAYLDIRFRYYGKKQTEKISFRNYLTKIVLFRNE